MTTIALRTMIVPDVDDVLALEKRTGCEYWDRERLELFCRRRSCWGTVAMPPAPVNGFAGYAAIEQVGKVGYVRNVVVRRRFRKNGLGRTIVMEAASHFHHCRTFAAHVAIENEDAAKFFAACGFEEIKRFSTWRIMIARRP